MSFYPLPTIIVTWNPKFLFIYELIVGGCEIGMFWCSEPESSCCRKWPLKHVLCLIPLVGILCYNTTTSWPLLKPKINLVTKVWRVCVFCNVIQCICWQEVFESVLPTLHTGTIQKDETHLCRLHVRKWYNAIG